MLYNLLYFSIGIIIGAIIGVRVYKYYKNSKKTIKYPFVTDDYLSDVDIDNLFIEQKVLEDLLPAVLISGFGWTVTKYNASNWGILIKDGIKYKDKTPPFTMSWAEFFSQFPEYKIMVLRKILESEGYSCSRLLKEL